MATLENLKALSQDQLIAMLLEQAKQPARKVTFKVSEKGAVSAYGLGRFPVTLYGTQWERLLAEADALKAFLVANASLLAVKA